MYPDPYGSIWSTLHEQGRVYILCILLNPVTYSYNNHQMYILSSDFSGKTIQTYLKLEIRFEYREFLAFKYVFNVFFQNKLD